MRQGPPCFATMAHAVAPPPEYCSYGDDSTPAAAAGPLLAALAPATPFLDPITTVAFTDANATLRLRWEASAAQGSPVLSYSVFAWLSSDSSRNWTAVVEVATSRRLHDTAATAQARLLAVGTSVEALLVVPFWNTDR